MAKTEKIITPLNVLVQPSLHAKMLKAAHKNGRSLSGEARYALTEYVKGMRF